MIAPLATRLRQQRLVDPSFETPDDVVAWMGAVQAQEFGPVRWAIGQRMVSATDAAIEQAFNDGRLVRTHILRPTWHFVHPRDIRWMLSISGPRVHVANGSMYRREGLDSKMLVRGAKVMARALEGGHQLTRTEIAAKLKAARLPHAGQALAYMVMYAELEGIACSGPRRGKQFTYALLDERVPPASSLSTDEAIAELTRRYFTSHGPATVRDFTWWSGLTVAQAKTGIALVGTGLERLDVDGRAHWQAPGATGGRVRTPIVRLVPIYDESLVAYRDREWVRSLSATTPVTMTPNTFVHQLVVDGRVEGSWLPVSTPDGVEVRVTPWGPLATTTRKALGAEVDRYGAFLGHPARLIVE